MRKLSIAILASLCFVTSCFLPGRDADDLGKGKQPGDYYGDDRDVDAGVTEPDTCPNPGSSSVHVRVRTSANGGKYAPRNVGAIWIENANGTFVRTLEVWASVRRRYLSRWRASSSDNVVDAVTGATKSSHTMHDLTWSLDEVDRCTHTAGAYRVVIEHTDYNGAGPTLEVPFTMGAPATVMPADQTTFHEVLVELH